MKKEHDEERNPRKNTIKIHQPMQLRRRCLRRSQVREIWVHVGVSNLGFLICCSCICFRFVVPSCFFWFVSYSFVFLFWCSSCFCVLVFFMFLFWCSNVHWNLFMKLESLKLEFQIGNWVLKTQVPCGFFSTSDPTTYKWRLKNSSFILELEF